jgi:hypothetical protein
MSFWQISLAASNFGELESIPFGKGNSTEPAEGNTGSGKPTMLCERMQAAAFR